MIALVLAFVAVSLALTSFALAFCQVAFDFRRLRTSLLNVRLEHSIPTWYSSCLLLLCSILILAIAFGGGSNGGGRLRWAVLSLVFVYLSMDEALRLHERVGAPVGKAALLAMGFSPPSLLFSRPWVVYGTALTVVVGLACLKLVRGLPGRTRRLLLGAGALYVGGAIGIELVWALYKDLYGRDYGLWILILIPTIEELLEMLGVVVAIYALLSYLGSRPGETRISFV